MVIGTKHEFESLAQYVLDDYMSSRQPKELYAPIDVKDFAINYLHMIVKYIQFPPKSRIAGMRKGNEILLDEALLEKGKEGIHNFTLAHECAHELINWQDKEYQPPLVTDFRNISNSKKKRLETEEDFKEWQANVVAAYLLMPPLLMGWCFYSFAKMQKINIYGKYYMSYNDKKIILAMKEYLKVSKEALLIRLEQLSMLEHKTMNEYYALGLSFNSGGDSNSTTN